MNQDRERLHTAVLVAPSKERRKLRKQRRRAGARLHAEQRKAELAAAKARAEVERAERRATIYLPKSGEQGAAQLRTPGRFRLPRHQDTSATLAGAYPFVAEGGLGADGVFVGQDLYSGGSFVYDPWVLYARGIITAPNVVLAGIVGSGKSSLAKSLYTRSLPFGRRVYVPGDPKGEHTAVANAVGGRAIVLGHGLNTRLNPLDEGHRPSGLSDEQWASTVAARRRDLIGALAETVLARALSPLEHTAIDLASTQTVRENAVPILPMVVDRILNPSTDTDGRLAEDGRLVGHALRRLVAGDLAGLFDGPSTVTFDPTLPMISLDLSRVTENSTLISVLMTCSSAWMESALLDPNGGQRWVIYDEAWRLMSHPALLRRMDAHWRLARHYGIANMLIFHKLTDLDNVGDQGSAMRSLANSLLANAETRIVYRQESDQLGPTAQALGLTGTEQQLLPNLGVGQGLWRIKARSFVTQHQLHPAELALFDTSSRGWGSPMNLSRPHHTRDHEPEVPVDLPNVVVTVAANGTLTAAVDGIAHPQPAAGAWTRATFGALMDEITKDRTISVRVEVRECDGGVFTDIIHARKRTPPVRVTEQESVPVTRRGRRVATPRALRLMEVDGEGFVPGEDVAVAVIVSHTDAAGTGTARALVDLDDLPHGSTGEVILFGRISGTTSVRRLQ